MIKILQIFTLIFIDNKRLVGLILKQEKPIKIVGIMKGEP